MQIRMNKKAKKKSLTIKLGTKPKDMPVTVEHLNQALSMIDSRFHRQDEKLELRFQKTERRLDSMDQRFERIEQRLDRMDERFDRIEHRLDRMDERFEQIERRLDQITDLLAKVMVRLDKTNLILMEQDSRNRYLADAYNVLDARVTKIEKEIFAKPAQ